MNNNEIQYRNKNNNDLLDTYTTDLNVLDEVAKPEGLEEKKVAIYPIDPDWWCGSNDIFKSKLTSKNLKGIFPSAKGDMVIYETKIGSTSIEYQILEKRLEEIRQDTIKKHKKQGNQAPALYQRADFITNCIVCMAYKQQTNCPTFTKTELLEQMNYTEKEISKGGIIFNNIEVTLKYLASITYNLTNKKKGKDYKEVIGHILENIYISGQGKNTKYTIKVNDVVIKAPMQFIIGQKNPQGKYTAIPFKYLKDCKNLSPQENSFIQYLISLFGLKNIYEITGKFLLKKIGITDKELKRPSRCFEILRKCLSKAIKLDYLKNHQINYGNPTSKDIRKWKFKLFLANKKVTNIFSDNNKVKKLKSGNLLVPNGDKIYRYSSGSKNLPNIIEI